MMIEALFNLFINILPILMFILVFAFGLYIASHLRLLILGGTDDPLPPPLRPRRQYRIRIRHRLLEVRMIENFIQLIMENIPFIIMLTISVFVIILILIFSWIIYHFPPPIVDFRRI